MKPMGLLHLIVGPWASGKTTLVPHLAVALPECVVFDWDVVITGLRGGRRKSGVDFANRIGIFIANGPAFSASKIPVTLAL